MDLGPLEGGYLELLNSSADPLQLYHLYDQMDLVDEEIDLCSGGLSSLWPRGTPWHTAGSAGRGAPVSTADSSRACMMLSLTEAISQPLPVSPAFPTSPLPRSFLFHSRGFSPTEPDTDTINCEQFSKLLCDIEDDEETREAYANIGEEVP